LGGGNSNVIIFNFAYIGMLMYIANFINCHMYKRCILLKAGNDEKNSFGDFQRRLAAELAARGFSDMQITAVFDAVWDATGPSGGALPDSEAVKDSKREPTVGQRMPDGTVYAGVSPDTAKAMYVKPHDEPMTMSWSDAKRRTVLAKVGAYGHNDWVVPSRNELALLFNNRAVIGNFTDELYWSSTESRYNGGWFQRFSDGTQGYTNKDSSLLVRCVRSAG
jgi:hypothetical protein